MTSIYCGVYTSISMYTPNWDRCQGRNDRSPGRDARSGRRAEEKIHRYITLGHESCSDAA
jgi:hypothetical protein